MERLVYEGGSPELQSDDADTSSLFAALDNSLTYFGKDTRSPLIPASGPETFRGREVHRSVALFRKILANAWTDEDLFRRVKENFRFIEARAQDKKTSLLLTGYYEPLLEGSLQPGGGYLYPLYRRPGDLVETPGNTARAMEIARLDNGRAVPYFSRREIDTEGVLRGRGLEIAWLKDPWERFSLHVQGSGKIRLPDGRIIGVGFAGSNGRAYRSIGRHLIEKGYIKESEANLPRVREFVRNNPALAEEIYNVNERYIFFRTAAGTEGPVGSIGVPLTPGRSIAADPAVFPRGCIAYLVSRRPVLNADGTVEGWKPIRRFVLNQDAGAAIKGPSRIDLFFGSGDLAGAAAGEMREEGKIYILMAK